MTNIVSIIIVAILGVIGNIAYFEYQSRKNKSKDILMQRLTNLLLPLYKIVHLEEMKYDTWNASDDGDGYAIGLSELPKRNLKDIEKIITTNMYLADDHLHQACINYLEWAYSCDTNKRFQKLMTQNHSSSKEDEAYQKFVAIVIHEYANARHQYQEK